MHGKQLVCERAGIFRGGHPRGNGGARASGAAREGRRKAARTGSLACHNSFSLNFSTS